MTVVGIIVWLVVGAVVGLAGWSALRALGQATFAHLPWAMAAALLGSFAWSEWFGDFSHWGGELDGLYLVPAVLGAAIVTALYAAGHLMERRGRMV